MDQQVNKIIVLTDWVESFTNRPDSDAKKVAHAKVILANVYKRLRDKAIDNLYRRYKNG